jgi:DNA-directed RNA polymerase specialized sigma24 family protein
MTNQRRSTPSVLGDEERTAFTAFFRDAEPRLRRALVAAYGGQAGREATAEALAWAWEHWAEVVTMANPVGYLYRVGQSRARTRVDAFSAPDRTLDSGPWIEPGLLPALATLSERQRVAVVLIHGYGWTYREVGELTGTSVTTVQNHLERGLSALRKTLGVPDV